MLQMPEKAAVIGPEIRLGEVAVIITQDKALSERLLRLNVAQAAPAGQVFSLTRRSLRIALYREGYNLKNIQFSGPKTTKVVTASQSFLESKLLPQAKTFVAGQLKEDPEDVDVKLSTLDRAVTLPAGKVEAHFLPSFSGTYQGLVLLTARLDVDGREVRQLPIRLSVNVMHPAVVTRQAVRAGEKFSSDDVSVVRWPEDKTPPNPIRELSGVVGRTASVFLGPGTVVALNDLYDPPVIHRGAQVSGVVRQGNVELTVAVRAIEDGKMGDVIRVENTDTHKLLKAKVLDEKTVLIETETP